jgi:uncharacterized protein (DUF362 family)
MGKVLTRRRVIVGAGLGAVGLVGAALLKYRPLHKRDQVPADASVRDLRMPSPGQSLPDMAIAQGEGGPAALTDSVLAAMGGMARFITKGDVVVVKPNVTWKRTPLQAANTNPDVVAVVVREALRAGAKRVIVTDHAGMDPVFKFETSGIGKAATNAGGEIEIVKGDEAFEDVMIRGQVLDSWPVLKSVMSANKVINVPVAKQHGAKAVFSACMKNAFGILGGDRVRLHWELQASIVDVAAFLRPTLHVIDATRVLIRNGPQGGNMDDVAEKNTVVATVDPVAGDAFCSHLLGIDPSMVPYIAMAEARGLGKADWEKVVLRRVG